MMRALNRRLIFCTLILAGLAATLTCRSARHTKPDLRHIDTDHDGRTDIFETSRTDGSKTRVIRAPSPGADPLRTVVLAIDAIPFEIFEQLQAEGLFRAFYPASRLVAPFPSLTNVSFTTILRTAPSAAYEDRYFDPTSNRMVGGMVDRLTNRYKSFAPYHEVFDWEEPRLWGAFVFFLPERIAQAELLKIEEQLLESEDPELVLYIGSTDALGHKLGRGALEEHLRRVDGVLERFLAAGGGDRRVVLFSDHGMSSVRSRMVDLESALSSAGFSLRDHLEEPNDVVAPAYGLVGSIQLYTACGAEQSVARAVIGARGVDFAVWLEGEAVGAVDASGSADPLDRPDEEYPQLRGRVEAGVRNHTLRPASVLVSLADGWHYGDAMFDRIVALRGTHGSARYSSSVGFLASNVDRTPEWIQARDAYRYLGLGQATVPEVRVADRCDEEAVVPSQND